MTDEAAIAEQTDCGSGLPRLNRAVLAPDVLAALREEVGLRQETIAQSSSTSVRTVRNWEKGQSIRARNADKVFALGEVVLALQWTLRGDGFDQWLRARIRDLGGNRPMEVLGEGDLEAVLAAAKSFAGGEYV
jgi:transcriptional regulator with XRE-family HTH domain